jgi:hypothetical protein
MLFDPSREDMYNQNQIGETRLKLHLEAYTEPEAGKWPLI